MTQWCAGLLLLLAQPLALAGLLAPEDFAYGARLTAPDSAAIYRLALPVEVYRGATRPDLGDLRVFNSQGEPVPHALRRPSVGEGDEIPPSDLPLFPFERLGPAGGERVSVKVTTDDQGAVVDVDSKTEAARDGRISSYLVDASSLARGPRPNGLELDWSGPEVVRVQVAASDDLSGWQSLAADATLVRLDFAGHRLERSRLPIAQRRYRYLRLRVPAGGEPLLLTRVQARFASRHPEPRRDWVRLEGRPADDPQPAWEFDTLGGMPVDRLELAPLPRNSLVSVRLMSRAEPRRPWQERARALLYQLEVDGVELASRSLDLAPAGDRYWRLEITSDPAGLGPGAPQVGFGWRPHEAHFLARGEGPFLLAYGRGGMQPSIAPIHALLKGLAEDSPAGLVGQATVRDHLALGGPDRLRPPVSLPWRSLALWAVLLLGVALLAWMAWCLLRQMNPGTTE